MDDLSNSVIFPRGGKLPGEFSKNFTGQAYLEMLSGGGDGFNCPIGNVTFEPGCRNNWHRHPGGQILLVTGGREDTAGRKALARRGEGQLVRTPFHRNQQQHGPGAMAGAGDGRRIRKTGTGGKVDAAHRNYDASGAG